MIGRREHDKKHLRECMFEHLSALCASLFFFFREKVGQDKLQAYTHAEQHPHILARFLLFFSHLFSLLSYLSLSLFPPSLPVISLPDVSVSLSLSHVRSSSRLFTPELLCLSRVSLCSLFDLPLPPSSSDSCSRCKKYQIVFTC